MKKSAIILLLGLLACTAAFAGFYYFGMAGCRGLMRQPQPELAWLRKEFHLSDAEFARISQLHQAYLPQCRQRCRLVQQQDGKLQQLLAQAKTVTPEIQTLLADRAKTRADCEAEMLKHFLAVSRTMPPDQGRRYLDWVQNQTSLRGQAMEQRHRIDDEPSHM
jgi:small-conductance mechanosensitive channel